MTPKIPKILIIDDEKNLTRIMKKFCEAEGYESHVANSGEEAMEILEKSPFHAAFLDLNMPGISGFEVLEKGIALRPECSFIMMTAQDTMDNAIEAMKKGAYDYLSKPFDIEEVKFLVDKVMKLFDLKERVEKLRTEIVGDSREHFIVGKSQKIRDVFKAIGRVAASDTTVLLLGESGTGKELVAKAIHYYSSRVGKPFVKVNCAAIPSGILESELFGHKKGSFSGAYGTTPGKFQSAEEGTIFLDEIGELEYSIQGKILRALQEKEIETVGESRTRRIDVRIVTATNKDLKDEVANKRFREDLYYRLNIFPIVIPPLRERKEDIPLLASHFINKFREEMNLTVKYVTDGAEKMLMDYAWPGNVRELENVILRGMLLKRSEFLSEDDIASAIGTKDSVTQVTFEDSVRETVDRMLETESSDVFMKLTERFESALIKAVMSKTGLNQSKAAEILGISRNTLRKKLEGKE